MKLTPAELLAMPASEAERRERRRRQIAHRRLRSLNLGPHMRLQFEDAQTVRHQLREVVRAERITDPAAVQHEIDAYAHLLPGGSDWKATAMIELPDAQQRRRELPVLNEAVHRLFVELERGPGDPPRIWAEANEDQPDRHRSRLSGVHFLRFPITAALGAALHSGRSLWIGCAHDGYRWRRMIPPRTLLTLVQDLRPAQEPLVDA
jgi:hypothetical protein